MLTETLIKLFKRDLGKLKVEVDSYRNEANLWIVNNDISNSAGNLCLHLVGNLNYFIGAILGDSGYIRQRDLEFSLKDISKSELITQINNTIEVVESTLSSISKEDLQKEYKRLVFEDTMTTEYFLVHLTTHLAYHLGQINYHRRLLD
ncbi:DinB family protein [uncultured Winogradskyella sp.]|uniref:DinB family protein n=1 Tax=uncultured Winogradskyella sp. TaxID=395353 RepID=UPI0030D7DB28|tara:strand:+ start:397 stop:840 length:444 start_codon:yes stop_codon:yes gene_type:complete